MRHRASGFTIIELLVVLGVIALLAAIGLPVIQNARETSRRAGCVNHLRQIGLALYQYHDQHQVFPPGQINAYFSSADPYGTFADPAEARNYKPGNTASVRPGEQGTSLFLLLLPMLKQEEIYHAWKFTANVHRNGASLADGGDPPLVPNDQAALAYPARADIATFYCPSRRSTMEANSSYALVQRVDPSWRSGGNDYAGCVGSGVAFTWKAGTEYSQQTYLLSADQLARNLLPGSTRTPFAQDPLHQGIFGVNSRTTMKDLTDGASSTIAVCERRIFRRPAALRGSAVEQRTSCDGWAWGGPATLFSTVHAPQPAGDPFGRFFDEAGSEHPLGLNVLMADGRVQLISLNIDLRSWQNLGNRAQGTPVDTF